MKKGWRIVGTIVLVLILLGAICIGVGFMTGGDVQDIYAKLNVQYNLSGIWELYSQWAVTVYHNLSQWVVAVYHNIF